MRFPTGLSRNRKKKPLDECAMHQTLKSFGKEHQWEFPKLLWCNICTFIICAFRTLHGARFPLPIFLIKFAHCLCISWLFVQIASQVTTSHSGIVSTSTTQMGKSVSHHLIISSSLHLQLAGQVTTSLCLGTISTSTTQVSKSISHHLIIYPPHFVFS